MYFKRCKFFWMIKENQLNFFPYHLQFEGNIAKLRSVLLVKKRIKVYNKILFRIHASLRELE